MLITLLVIALVTAACGSGGKKVDVPARAATADAKLGAETEGAPPAGPKPEPDLSKIITDDRLLDVTMRFAVSAIGIEGCSGDLGVRLRLQLDKSKEGKPFEIPKDTVSCLLVGNIDIKKMLEAPEPPGKPDVPQPFVVEEGVIATKLLGQGYFPETPSPVLPSIFATAPEKLRELNVYRLLKATDWVSRKTANGTATMKTIAYQEKFFHEPMQREFKEVYDFELTHTGFTGVGKVKAMLFDRMMLRISLKPLAFLRIELQTTAGDLLEAAKSESGGGAIPGGGLLDSVLGGGGGGIGGLISGLVMKLPVHLEGDLLEQAGLPAAGEEAEDGVVIGR